MTPIASISKKLIKIKLGNKKIESEKSYEAFKKSTTEVMIAAQFVKEKKDFSEVIWVIAVDFD